MDIEYDLHDSGIYEATSGPRREINLLIDPYSILFPNVRRIELRFGGISNFEECESLVKGLNSEFLKRPGVRCRIESFRQNEDSKPGKLKFELEIEYFGEFEVFCSSIQWESYSKGR